MNKYVTSHRRAATDCVVRGDEMFTNPYLIFSYSHLALNKCLTKNKILLY